MRNGYFFRLVLSVFSMFFYINSNLFGADPTITNVKAEVLKHDDETQYVKITYTAKDFPAAGAVVKFSALCIGSTLFTLKPTSSEISGDIGLITSDGAKTILWEDELTLIRTNLQDKYLCNALLSIEGNESSVSEVALNVSKYKESTWYYFATGQLQMQIEKIVGGEPQFSCSTLGNEWHHEAIAAGATFYKVSSVNLPVYKGRNPGDKFKGTVDRNTCSAFLAIKDYGKSTQKIWANFARQFVQTNDINGTNITQDFEFQFRYTEDSKTGAKSLSVGNAGKQGQQIYSELNIGEIMDITLYTGVIGQVKSNEFEINVPRREWKYVYKGKHIFTVKTTDKKAKFVGGLLEHHIYLDGGTEVVIGDALKFVQVASLSIDTTIDNSKINFDGKCLMNGVEVFNLPLTTLRLNDSLLFSSPVPMGMGAAAYFLAGIAPIFDRIRVIGDPNSPTEALADIRLIFKTFSDGCDIILHPSDNTGGVVFRDMKITSNGWSFPAAVQLNNIGVPTSDKWCLKNLLVTYDKPTERFAFDGVLKAPMFSDIGMGCTFIKGDLEQFKILAKLGSGGIPVPIPEPPPAHVGVWRGFEAEVSNWKTGPKTLRGTLFFANRDDWEQVPAFDFLKQELGSKVTEWQIFEAEGTMQGNELGEIGVDGKIRFLGKIDVWAAQLRGGYSLAFNLNQPLMYAGLNNVGADIIQLGGDKFLLSGTVNGSINVLPKFVFSVAIKGDFFIPDLFKNHPLFQLVNTKLGLPIRLSSVQAMLRNTQISVDLNFGWLGVWSAWVDISKNPFTETRSFMGLQSGSIKDLGGIAFYGKGNEVQANDTTYIPFTINVATNYAYAEIKSATPPASFLVSPTQKVFTSTSTDSLIIFSASKSVNDVDLWVLKNPEMGQWKVGVVGKKNGDSVHIWSLVKQRADFTFSAVQIARTVNCNWDNSGASDESFVDFYLDKDNKGYDGYRIGTVNEKTGSFSYTLSDSLMECGYYIYAVRWDNKQATNFVYSPNSFVNNKKILPPPSNATGFYTDKGIVKLRWNKSPDPLSAFYVIKVTDENGKDSLYATVSSIETEAELIVQSPSTKSFSIQTIGLNNTSGCWVKFSNLMLGIDEEKGAWLSTENPIVVIPNPASTQATIHFTLQHDAQTRVVLVNTLGQIVTELTNSVLQQGMHSVQCSTALISDGMYFVRVITPQEQFSTPMTVVR